MFCVQTPYFIHIYIIDLYILNAYPIITTTYFLCKHIKTFFCFALKQIYQGKVKNNSYIFLQGSILAEFNAYGQGSGLLVARQTSKQIHVIMHNDF